MAEQAVVRMYSRRTCGLCDKARAVLVAEQGRLGFRLEEVSVDGDDELERTYGLRVPVVLIDGVEQFEFEVQPGRLRRLMARDGGD